ncbi:hypothetical protein BDN72DRAFT_878971 [Pluteus cervinus]|uniref:Uncharacterized protein n=1 Tax=Pluteus cervinus TaxID=181527 RepID=A0ACD3AU79_9AGAR|nr:hypothetical protein BDN72DRAFT_878971 [Pluteus cervinus]
MSTSRSLNKKPSKIRNFFHLKSPPVDTGSTTQVAHQPQLSFFGRISRWFKEAFSRKKPHSTTESLPNNPHPTQQVSKTVQASGPEEVDVVDNDTAQPNRAEETEDLAVDDETNLKGTQKSPNDPDKSEAIDRPKAEPKDTTHGSQLVLEPLVDKVLDDGKHERQDASDHSDHENEAITPLNAEPEDTTDGTKLTFSKTEPLGNRAVGDGNCDPQKSNHPVCT